MNRREFLKKAAVLGVAGPAVITGWPSAVDAGKELTFITPPNAECCEPSSFTVTITDLANGVPCPVCEEVKQLIA